MAQQETANRNTRRNQCLPVDELSIFCEQVALILSSGVPIFDGMEALCENYQGTQYEKLMQQLNETVKQSGSLHTALQESGVFPPYLVYMMRIGEQTGKMDEVAAALAVYYDREQKIRQTVRSAVIYPACLVGMIAVVILILVVNVLPIFRQVYQSLGSEISGASSSLMNFAMNLGVVVLALVGIVLVIALILALMMKTNKRQAVIDFTGRIFSPIRRLNASQIARRFAGNLGMMLSSGYPLEEAMTLIESVMDDPHGREKVKACRVSMENGKSFPQAVAEAGIFEPLHNKMVQMGYTTGQTDKVMNKLAALYEEQMDSSISRLVAFIEPAMVVLLSIIIGAILLSVMLPMVSIMTSIL